MPTYQKSLIPTTTSLDYRSRSGTRHLVTLLRQAGLTAKAARVARCCAEFWVQRCPNRHLARAIPVERCQYRLCLTCAYWRQTRTAARLWPAIQQLLRRFPDDRWVLITLTVGSTREPLNTLVPRLQGHFARLRRMALWKRGIRGGVYSIETIYHPTTGWHVHLHALAARQAWCDQKALAAAWQRASRGEGQVVDIRDRDQDVRWGRAPRCATCSSPRAWWAGAPSRWPSSTRWRAASLASAMGPCGGSSADWQIRRRPA
jgi:hypothetical protein